MNTSKFITRAVMVAGLLMSVAVPSVHAKSGDTEGKKDSKESKYEGNHEKHDKKHGKKHRHCYDSHSHGHKKNGHKNHYKHDSCEPITVVPNFSAAPVVYELPTTR